MTDIKRLGVWDAGKCALLNVLDNVFEQDRRVVELNAQMAVLRRAPEYREPKGITVKKHA